MSVKLFAIYGEVEVKWWTFPAGERGVKILKPLTQSCQISCSYESSEDLIDLALLVNAARNLCSGVEISLYIPYFPYARQDRVMSEGESHSLQVIANFINSMNFHEICVLDAHSDVIHGLFPAGVLKIIEQCELLEDCVKHFENMALVSPDAGALKKVYKLAKALNVPVLEAGKVRDVNTGNIVKTKVDDFDVEAYNTLVVVDDICDGGRTFIELGKVIREKGFCGKLVLAVTHGIFSQGKKVFEGIFDEVVCVNNMEKENV